MTPLFIACQRCYRAQFCSMLRRRVIVGVGLGAAVAFVGKVKGGEAVLIELTPASPGWS